MNSLCIARSAVSYIVHDIERREEDRSASTTLAPLVEESASNVVAAPMTDENYETGLGSYAGGKRKGWGRWAGSS